MPNHTNQTIQTERQAVLILCISSGVKEAGQLELPQPLDEVSRQLDMISEKAGPDSSLYVRSVKSLLPSLNWHLQHIKLDNNSALQQLNQLAEAIERMNVAERYHLSKSLNTEFRQNLDDVLQIAAHIKTSSIDCYEVIPGVTSYQDLGKWLVEHDQLKERVPESLRSYLDYRSIGVDYRGEHQGEFLADGYTGIRMDSMEQVLAEQGVLRLTLATSKSTFPLNCPASDECLDQAKRALGVEDLAQASITAVKFSAPDLAGLIPLDTVSVEEINTFALCLQEMEREDGGMITFCAALEAEQPDTFTEALNIAMGWDDYEQVPENMDEYGKQILRGIGADDEVISTIDGYMDFAQLGEDTMEEQGVRRTEFGLVRRLSKPFPPEQEIGQTMM